MRTTHAPSVSELDAVIEVTALGVLICSTSSSLRVLETFHPPTYYLPPTAFAAICWFLAGAAAFASGKASPATGIWWWVSSVWRGHLEL